MISILIVNWNTCELLRSCLLSLRAACARFEYEIIAVENASNDGSAAMIQTAFPEVRLFASETNLGFAEGNNLAYAMAKGDWIWLLNPDTEVVSGAPERLLEFMEARPRCAAVASALIDARDGTIQRSCRTFPTPAALWVEAAGLASAYPRSHRYGFYRMGWWSYRDARPVEQPMASSLMIRRAAIDTIVEMPNGQNLGRTPEREDVGHSASSAKKSLHTKEPWLFDPLFPIYFNDVDLCWRLWQAGWEIWYCPDSHVRHWGGASTSQIKPQMIAESHRSLERFYLKHWRQKYAPLLLGLTLALVRVSGWVRVWRANRRQTL
jgi:GT2 family glycosyltransferase